MSNYWSRYYRKKKKRVCLPLKTELLSAVYWPKNRTTSKNKKIKKIRTTSFFLVHACMECFLLYYASKKHKLGLKKKLRKEIPTQEISIFQKKNYTNWWEKGIVSIELEFIWSMCWMSRNFFIQSWFWKPDRTGWFDQFNCEPVICPIQFCVLIGLKWPSLNRSNSVKLGPVQTIQINFFYCIF